MRVSDPTLELPPDVCGFGGQPVLLATLGVPFDTDAVAVAIGAAVESAVGLVITTLIRGMPIATGKALTESMTHPVHAQLLRATSHAASERGVPTTILWAKGPRTGSLLRQVIAEQRPGLIVFGPDRARVSKRQYQKTAEVVCDAGCLIWVAEPCTEETPQRGIGAPIHVN